MVGDLASLTPERAEELRAKIANWEQRINRELFDAIEAEQSKQRRKK